MRPFLNAARSAQGIFSVIMCVLLGAATAAAVEMSTGRSIFDFALGIF